MGKEQNAKSGGIKAAGKRQRTLSSTLHVSCLALYALLILLILSSNVFPAEEEQSDPDSQQAKQQRTVSISTGPDGKIKWLLGKNLGTAHGDAVVEYDDVILKADHIWADLDAEVIEARGNVRLITGDQTVTAEFMLFDLKSKKGIMRDGMSFDDPWYHSGEKMSRLSADDSFIEKGDITSCSLDHPHFYFEASHIVIHLKKEIIAKHVIFKIGGIPLLYLPVYRRSLEEDEPSRYILKLGSNSFEGYYAKNILPARWRMIAGSLFFNFTARRGKSGGAEFDYDADKISLREIFIPVPEGASNKEVQEVRAQMNEIRQRARGELDKVWLRQIFIRFQIQEEDKIRARERAEEVLEKCREEDANFAQLARRWSDDKDTKNSGGYLGSFTVDEGVIKRKEGKELVPVKPAVQPILEAALKLEPEQISDLMETEDGYQIIKLDSKDEESFRARHIFIMSDPSDEAQEEAQKKADEILIKLDSGTTFEELAQTYSDDQSTKDEGGDMGWQTFQDLDMAFHSVVRNLDKGETSRPVITQSGVYIFRLVEKEETPSFADLARQYSQAPTAEMGGDIGYVSQWELEPKLRREAFRLEIGSISRLIKTNDGYRIVKIEKKRRLGGDFYSNYSDLYSYQREKNPIKLGQTWNINIHHNQTLWRGGEQQDRGTFSRQLRMDKALGMRAELSLAGTGYKEVYQSYTPEQELRSYCAFDYYWMSRTGSRGTARLIIDATKDLLGEDTGRLQKYPAIDVRLPNYRLYELQPFKKINSGLHFIADRVQGKAGFAEMARQVSDDDRTKEKGGDLGWFRSGESGISSKVERSIFSDPPELNPGDISKPISVMDGYHIVKLEDVEEEQGKRERAKARHIFIAIDPDIRTKDEASKLVDKIYRKLVEGNRPSLGFLTLDNTSFSFGTSVGNYYKDVYRDEKSIWLQTVDAKATLSKRAIIRLGLTREFNLDLSGDYREIWHSKTQPLGNTLRLEDREGLTIEELDARETNIFSNAWSARISLGTNLHRIFRSRYIPGIYALKHTINPSISFSYAPPGESEERRDENRPSLYPFGAAVWTYEQKRLTARMTNTIDVKTKGKREKLSLFRWTVSAGADFTEEKDSERRFDRMRNTFTLTPHKQVVFNTRLDHNWSNIGTDEPLLISFNSDIKYSDPDRKWTAYLSRQNVYYQYGQQWTQYFSGKIDLRWSRMWSLRFDLTYEYDEQVHDIYKMNVSMHRMLHCWESRIGFRRTGTRATSLRRDFYFQIDLLADPGKALGVGYDDVTKSWALRSLPGMGRLGGFLRPGSSMYY